jgi:hypothetical protein
MEPWHIVVLTDDLEPLRHLRGIEQATIQAPTRDNILEAARRLGRHVVRYEGSGLISWSGHGVALPATGHVANQAATMGLCPGDLSREPDGFHGVFSLGQLGHAVGDDAGIHVTAYIDACYGVTTDRTRGVRGLAGGLTVVHDDQRDIDPSKEPVLRMVLGATAFGSAYEIPVDGVPRGAFSHAVQVMLSRWQTVQGPRVRFMDCSYGDLLFRAQQLLSVYGLEQYPTLLGRIPLLNILPVMRRFGGVLPEATSPIPNGGSRRVQLTGAAGGNTIYTLTAVGASKPAAVAVVPGTNAPWGKTSNDYGGDTKTVLFDKTEFWWFDTDEFVEDADYTWNVAPNVTWAATSSSALDATKGMDGPYRVLQNPNWGTSMPTMNSGTDALSHTDTNGDVTTLAIGYSGSTVTEVFWGQSGSQALLFDGDDGDLTMVASTSPPTALTEYSAAYFSDQPAPLTPASLTTAQTTPDGPVWESGNLIAYWIQYCWKLTDGTYTTTKSRRTVFMELDGTKKFCALSGITTTPEAPESGATLEYRQVVRRTRYHGTQYPKQAYTRYLGCVAAGATTFTDDDTYLDDTTPSGAHVYGQACPCDSTGPCAGC